MRGFGHNDGSGTGGVDLHIATYTEAIRLDPNAASAYLNRDLGQKRTLLSLLDQFSRSMADSLLADSDEAFHDTLIFTTT